MSSKNHKEEGHRPHVPHGHGGGHEEHEGAPEWLISFADNVMLQMGFFVILLALNLKPVSGDGEAPSDQPGAEKGAREPSPALLDAAIAIREAFNNPVALDSTDPNDAPLIRRLLERGGSGEARDEGPKGDHAEVQTIRPSDYFGLGGSVPFEQGSGTLTEEARQTAAEIAKQIRGLRWIIEVRGHTSAAETFNLADHGIRLSYERASAVAEVLTRGGVNWAQVRVTGCGDNDRAAPTVYDKLGHRANQRVEVIVTDQTLPDYLPLDAAPPSAPLSAPQEEPSGLP